jgi:DNA-binding response OmpR family regulator
VTRRIVLIEDDPDTATLVEEMLHEIGHRVDTRARLEEGAGDDETELVITDLVPLRTFEVATAREWIARVRSMFPNAAVVVATAHAPAASAGAAAIDADVVLTKPFDVALFTRAVESVLSG